MGSDAEKCIVDVGCGAGGNLMMLQRYGRVVGMDISLTALSLCRSRWAGAILGGDIIQLPFRSNSVDVITVLDVLEHICDDVAALRECWRILKPGGDLIITVPSLRSLWSVHDIALRHYRRYSRAELNIKIRRAGFVIDKLSFAICPLLPIVFVFRKVQNLCICATESRTALIELPSPLNRALIALLALEAQVLRWFDLPFGVSLICRAHKPY